MVICQSRSCAWTKPSAKNTSSSVAPKICGTLSLLRTTSTGADRPESVKDSS
jgi:hypothetical protein